MSGKGKEIPGPIRDVNPCYKCQKPMRQPGCHDTCKKHATWKAEIERIKTNRREYERLIGIRIKRK